MRCLQLRIQLRMQLQATHAIALVSFFRSLRLATCVCHIRRHTHHLRLIHRVHRLQLQQAQHAIALHIDRSGTHGLQLRALTAIACIDGNCMH